MAVLKIFDSKIGFTKAATAIIITFGVIILALLGLDGTCMFLAQSMYPLSSRGIRVRNSCKNRKFNWIYLENKDDLKRFKGKDCYFTDFNDFANINKRKDFDRKNITGYYYGDLINIITVKENGDEVKGSKENCLANDYVVTMDKYYRITVISDLNNAELYCSRINKLKRDIKPETFSDRQLEGFISFHLNNLYGHASIIPDKYKERCFGDEAEVLKELITTSANNPIRDGKFSYRFPVYVERGEKRFFKDVYFEISGSGNVDIKERNLAAEVIPVYNVDICTLY